VRFGVRSVAGVRGERALLRLAAGQGLVDHDVRGVAEEVFDSFEDRRDVRAVQVRVEQVARSPALDERERRGSSVLRWRA
jgi:hypothetical protein